MGWRQRGNKRYFYRMRRNGRRVTYEYLGSGPAAARAAEEIADRKTLVRQRAAELNALRESAEPVTSIATQVNREVRLLIDAALLSAGFHQHKRSEWRQRRDRDRIAKLVS